MFRTRLLVFLAATALISACAASPTSPTSPRHAPRALHDDLPGGSSDTTAKRSGNVNPNG
jgi:hypothetical protein